MISSVVCPTPASSYDRVVLGHGSGGRLSHELISRIFVPAFANDVLARLEDQATVPLNAGRVALTTDAFVVRPIFFPGGDIGSLSVHGTLNDLSVGGAVPRHLTASFILEEGLALTDLQRVVSSMARACAAASVTLVAGDTKVVERGKGDQIFITTTGLGVVPPSCALSISAARPGDRVLVSGTLGDHGIAILALRDGLDLGTTLQSDSAWLGPLTSAMLETCPSLKCMRDLTRGGFTSALHELCAASSVGVELDEAAVPLKPEVRGACELLGLDPLYVANEGKLMAVVPAADAEALLSGMRRHPLGADAAIVGTITETQGRVVLRTRVGGKRTVSMLAGEQLPRIC
jgi:hydrogenase expression/formation protein HypE